MLFCADDALLYLHVVYCHITEVVSDLIYHYMLENSAFVLKNEDISKTLYCLCVEDKNTALISRYLCLWNS